MMTLSSPCDIWTCSMPVATQLNRVYICTYILINGTVCKQGKVKLRSCCYGKRHDVFLLFGDDLEFIHVL